MRSFIHTIMTKITKGTDYDDAYRKTYKKHIITNLILYQFIDFAVTEVPLKTNYP